MEYITDNEKAEVKSAVETEFPGYCISFMEDPDDSSVVLVRLYDVDVSNISEFKARLRDVLRNKVKVLKADLIPSIVSSENTRKYYAEYVRQDVFIDETVVKVLIGMGDQQCHYSPEP
ncbi:MAG: hypothetical protein IJG13_22925, partial [Kiritimatiellae bacterium]|nr:hypothetical protein [Kiritimatiellia bacterium]